MPFLRRRGNAASESDMRRLNTSDSASAAPQSQQRPPPDAVAPDALAQVDPLEDDDAAALYTSTVLPGNADSNARPASPPIQDETSKHRRFSVLRFRNASDSQLSLRAKQHAEQPPPIPRPPHIIKTAPTVDMSADSAQKKPSRIRLTGPFRKSADVARSAQDDSGKGSLRLRRRKTATGQHETVDAQFEALDQESARPGSSNSQQSRPSQANSIPALPTNDTSNVSKTRGTPEHESSAGSLSRSHTPSSFFRLPRRRPKPPEPLFPLSHLPQKSKSSLSTLRDSPATGSADFPPLPGSRLPLSDAASEDVDHGEIAAHTQSTQTLSKLHPSTVFRPGSTHSGQSSPTRTHLRLRGRSSTMSSAGRDSIDDHLAPPGTTRTSTSTGRKSFGDLFGLGRLRQNSDLTLGRQGTLTPVTPGSNTSKNNSLQLTRDPVVLPERQDDDTPARYLARLEDVMSRGLIASALSKGNDPFSTAVLRSYMRSFRFFGDPMDMAIRKLLMEAELPKETQQIDRCLEAFANRYHECNPGIYESPDQAYFIAFSLLILHTDVFNKNNKHKMQKADYLKNTRGEGIFDDILECFYDNITYTPFIHVEDDLDINGDRIIAHKTKKKILFAGPTNSDIPRRPSKEPLDPYTLILDSKLDVLRPTLKDAMHLEDHYGYLGTANGLNLRELQMTFFRTGILQIVSPRSRPDAFMTEKTATNPEGAHPGIVDIKITKVGLLWRKDPKKKKTRSPWQEWGAILTGAQLYFFRNTTWVKGLIHQYESHIKQGHEGIPIIFKPPLEIFKPDALMSTDGAVALLDSSYKKHKHAFVYVRHGGFEEVLLADDESEMNDWLAKLNYAAAFRTSGVRMRGVVGGNYEGQSRRGIRRLDSSDATQSIQTPTGEVTIARGRIDHKMAEDILTARRDIMAQKILEAEEKLAATQRQLDIQLRNARHLQILAPIQAKTRDQLLLAAARMSAQLKWTRMEIWKIRCHRDILKSDLEEERFIINESTNRSLISLEGPGPHPIERQHLSAADIDPSAVGGKQKANGSSGLLPLSILPSSSDLDSPTTEEYMTPPTSARLGHHDSYRSLETSGEVAVRKASVSSSVASSRPPTVCTPQSRPPTDAGETSGRPPLEQPDEVDADERDFLAKSGLVAHNSVRQSEHRKAAATNSQNDASEPQDTPSATDKLERNKIRRSLQRTLRESAGHLPHPRGRKGKDSQAGATPHEISRDDKLARGSGSFVVHGKKASVINFGSGFQNMSRDESLRQRKQKTSSSDQQPPSPSQANNEEEANNNGPTKGWERTESAASAGTATALSFRELHRKYSSAQASGTGARLTVPSDGDSEAAVSFSDGRRTPLPMVEAESGDETQSLRPGHDRPQSQFFTPEPPGSPASSISDGEDGDDSTTDTEQLARPPIQTALASLT